MTHFFCLKICICLRKYLSLQRRKIKTKFNQNQADMAKEQFTQEDYIKAIKKADREEEIAKYGKQISMRPTKVHKSKKLYNRRNKSINLDIE